MYFPVKVAALIVVTLLFLFSLLSGEEGRRPITAEDLWNMKRLGSLRLSPNGELAAIVVTEYDIGKNEGQGDIWLVATDGSRVRRFTTGEGTESSPAFCQCGRKLAFTAKREGKKSQLYVIPIEGGEAEKITDMPLGVSYPQWVPHDGGIIFVSRILPGFEADMDSMKAELERREKSKVTAKVTEDRLYRYWDHWMTDGEIPHFFRVDPESREVTDLTPGWDRYFSASGRVSYDVSPEGDEIAFTALRHGSPYDSLTTDIFLLSIDTPGVYRNITVENPSNDFSPYYTPDGRYILYGMQKIIGFYGDRVRLVRFDR